MLKYRIITALCLIPLVVWAIYSLQQTAFMIVSSVIALMMGLEWANLIGLHKWYWQGCYALALCVIAALCFYIGHSILYLALLAWAIALWLVLTYPRHLSLWRSLTVRCCAGFLLIIPFWLGLNQIHQAAKGASLLLFLMLIVWGADTGAYFAGRAFGRHKLAPAVSPGKTWEGLGGAIIICLMITIGGVILLPAPHPIIFIVLAMVVTLISVLGDLTESMVKRQQGVKDSGHLLPGHGGLLDRLDSLTAAVPCFAVGLELLKLT